MFIMALVLAFSASSACPVMYGRQNANGSWSFSESVQQGLMFPVEVDELCRTFPEDLEWNAKAKKYQINQSSKEARLNAEASERNLKEAKASRRKALAAKSKLTEDELHEVIQLLSEDK